MGEKSKINQTQCKPYSYLDTGDAGKFDKDVPDHSTKPVIGTEYKIKCTPSGIKEYSITRYYDNKDGTKSGVEIKIPQTALGPMANFFSPQAKTVKSTAIAPTRHLDSKIVHIAKVIYSETGGKQHAPETANPREKFRAQYLVASVIHNRVGRKSFGGPDSAYEACDSKGEFSCVGSTQNKHWKNAGSSIMTEEQKKTWEACLKMAKELQDKKFSPLDKTVVYFHAKSISKPSNWDNQYFSAPYVLECGGHKFYAAVKKETPKKTLPKETIATRK